MRNKKKSKKLSGNSVEETLDKLKSRKTKISTDSRSSLDTEVEFWMLQTDQIKSRTENQERSEPTLGQASSERPRSRLFTMEIELENSYY